MKNAQIRVFLTWHSLTRFVTYVKMELAVLQTRKSPNIEISQ